MIVQVDIRAAEKDLLKTPKALVVKFQHWVSDVERYGLEEVRKVSGWHDHALKGSRIGQRAIYVIVGDKIKIVRVIEVHPHEY
jgi:proteic killer suppression protein